MVIRLTTAMVLNWILILVLVDMLIATEDEEP